MLTIKKEGVIGFALMAVIIIVAILFFRPKDLDAALGNGFAPEDVTKIGIYLAPVDGGETLSAEITNEDEAFDELLRVLQDPTYSRTNTSDDTITLDYMVNVSFADADSWAWNLSFQGGRLVQAGTPSNMKTYQISGGQDSQQEILDYLLTLV